jgi:membrane fusion protein, multidrug efflux system
MAEPTTPTPAEGGAQPSPSPAMKSPSPSEWRKAVGRIISILVIAGAVVLVLWVWSVVEHHPRTDDATARANVVGIAPRARGQIIKLNVQDNQAVTNGEVLFEIDPADYEHALEQAKSALATLDQQIEIARSQDTQLKFQVKAAEAGVERAKAEFKQAGDTFQRIEPLLVNGFAKADDVDKAATAKAVAAAALAAAEEQLNQAQIALSTLATLNAERPGAVAAVEQASLDLSYCKVTAPFPGRVISLNISVGAYANIGMPVFSLLDTRKWYVMANFREGEIRYMPPASVMDVYLLAIPERHFRGTVQGIGWAVSPTYEIDIPHGLPIIQRELNWVHIAQRFPVRIEIENPDSTLFRMGASAVATLKSAPASHP